MQQVLAGTTIWVNDVSEYHDKTWAELEKMAVCIGAELGGNHITWWGSTGGKQADGHGK